VRGVRGDAPHDAQRAGGGRRGLGALRVLDRRRADPARVEQADQAGGVEDLARRVEGVGGAGGRDRDRERRHQEVGVDDADRQAGVARHRVADVDGEVDRGERGTAGEILARRLVASGGLEAAVAEEIADRGAQAFVVLGGDTHLGNDRGGFELTERPLEGGKKGMNIKQWVPLDGDRREFHARSANPGTTVSDGTKEARRWMCLERCVHPAARVEPAPTV
jgi:hypothetical protein